MTVLLLQSLPSSRQRPPFWQALQEAFTICVLCGARLLHHWAHWGRCCCNAHFVVPDSWVCKLGGCQFFILHPAATQPKKRLFIHWVIMHMCNAFRHVVWICVPVKMVTHLQPPRQHRSGTHVHLWAASDADTICWASGHVMLIKISRDSLEFHASIANLTFESCGHFLTRKMTTESCQIFECRLFKMSMSRRFGQFLRLNRTLILSILPCILIFNLVKIEAYLFSSQKRPPRTVGLHEKLCPDVSVYKALERDLCGCWPMMTVHASMCWAFSLYQTVFSPKTLMSNHLTVKTKPPDLFLRHHWIMNYRDGCSCERMYEICANWQLMGRLRNPHIAGTPSFWKWSRMTLGVLPSGPGVYPRIIPGFPFRDLILLSNPLFCLHTWNLTLNRDDKHRTAWILGDSGSQIPNQSFRKTQI